jgi:3-oxoacid CoA-transferase subunit A
MRAGGAGIPGFYTKTGVGTVIAEGKEHKDFDGETYILERGIVADLSIVKAWKADTTGNADLPQDRAQLQPARGDLRAGLRDGGGGDRRTRHAGPRPIHLPGIYVHRLIQGQHEKRIEQRTVRAA